MTQNVCCFSGYRPEKMPADMFEGSAKFQKMLSDLRLAITRASEQGYTVFLSGMSRGFDLWAAQTVLELQEDGLPIELWAAIAFHGMENGWEDDWQGRYHHAMKHSRYTFAICDSYEPGCYSRRDSFLVEKSSLCICYFDGVPGGTEFTVNAARKAGHGIINLAETL